MARLRYNGLSATLGASLTASATSVTFGAALTHSNGTSVPTITGSDYIPLVILDASGHESEVVYLTAYTAAATTGTIARGKEGTTGVTHSSGDKVVCAALAADATPTYPLEPSEVVDHFNGNTLDASWSLAGSYVSGDFTVSDGWLSCPTARAAGSYVYRTPPGSWSTITARLFSIVPASSWFGILAVDNTSAGVGFGATWHGSPDTAVIGALSAGAYVGSGGQTMDKINGSLVSQGLTHYVRLRKSGTSWFGSASLNGVNWSPETSALTNSTTVTRIGFGGLIATPNSFGVDWFHVV